MIAPADVELTRALERGELPAAGFPHASHLRVAWVYLEESSTVDEAVARMGATLRALTASVGQAQKYSGALTAFWIYQLAAARAMLPGAGIDEALRAYPRLLDTHLVLTYYSTDAPATRAPDSSSHPPHRPVSGAPA